MITQTTSETSHPEQSTQTSVDQKSAGKVTESEFARRLYQSQQARQAQDKPAETKPMEETPAQEESADEAKKTSTESESEEPQQETAEATTEEEADDVLSKESNALDPKLQEKFNKRIGKEVSKRKQLQSEIEDLRTQLAELANKEEKQELVSLPNNSPLSEIMSMDQLDTFRQNARRELRWVEGWLDEDIPQEGIQTDRGFATKAQLKEFKRNAVICLEDMIPEREKFLSKKTQTSQEAFQKFPFLNDAKSEGYQLAKTILKQNPWINNLPNADYVLGLQVKGMIAMKAEETAKPKSVVTKPKPKPTAGQSSISSDASTTRVPVGSLVSEALANENKAINAKKGVTEKDFAASLYRRQQIKQSR